MRDLGSLGGNCTIASDLNDRGQIVGGSTLAGEQPIRAFFWDTGVLHDFGGSLGAVGANTGATVINAVGQAVGFACLVGGTICHATLWKRIGELTDLGVIGTDQCGSYATGINERLQIVGSSISSCNYNPLDFRAFLWEDGTIFDLNALIRRTPLCIYSLSRPSIIAAKSQVSVPMP